VHPSVVRKAADTDRSTTRATLPAPPSALPADPIGDVGEVPLYANGTAQDLNPNPEDEKSTDYADYTDLRG
jgi:hypothetical protein